MAASSSWARTLLVAAVFAGCGDPLGPAPVEGVFVLESIGGQALPAHTMAGSLGTRVAAETLFFHRMRRGAMPQMESRVRQTGRTEASVESIQYARVGNTLEFTPPPCNDVGAICFWAGPTGQLDGERLIISYDFVNFLARSYRRVN